MKTEIWCHSLNSTVTASSVRLLHLSSLSSLTLASFMFAGKEDLTLEAGGGVSMLGNVLRLIPTVDSDTRWHHQTDPVGVICRDNYASKAASGKGVDVYLFLPHLRRVGWNSEKDENNAEWKFWVTVVVKPSGGKWKHWGRSSADTLTDIALGTIGFTLPTDGRFIYHESSRGKLAQFDICLQKQSVSVSWDVDVLRLTAG